MKRETLLTIAILALLVLNFATLGMMFMRRPPQGPRAASARFDQKIIESLHYNAEQQKQFEVLKQKHRQQIRESDQAYKNNLHHYFALLKNDTIPQAQSDSLLTVLTQIQKEKALVTFQHFADLKSLCTPEQRPAFNALLPELMQVIMPHKNRPGKRRK